ncbi:MAG: adenylate/guanylate cyclase domain-containing protein [Deltaproteobacteria bacterium]|nr:adenylate/guanylate cyclase domain-containing protein [Deltaproteobacteria bacterium]
MSSIAQDIAAAVETTLQREARHHELVLSVIAAAAMTLMVGVAVVMIFGLLAPGIAQPWWAAYYAVALAVMWGIALVLRAGWYHAAVPLLVPFATAGLLVPALEITVVFARAQGLSPLHAVPIGALSAAIILVTAAFRHRVSAVVAATIAAELLVIWSLHIAGSPVVDGIVNCVLLVPLAALTGWLSTATRRLVRSEAARITLGRFLPDGVVAGAWDDPAAVFARPRLMDATVLVTDLRGFTSWAEERGPEEVLGFLNEVQGAFADVVRAEGGTVDKFLGDGMLAVFGVTGASDHASSALSAAKRILVVAEQLSVKRGDVVKVGVGVHSGPVVVGCLGSGARLEFTVLGDTVNTASRLESLTKEHKVAVLISEETAKRADVELASIGTVEIRGRKAPMKLFGLR